MKDIGVIIFMIGLLGMMLFGANDIGKLNKEIQISRDHEKRLAIENSFRQYEISVLTQTILKEK